MAMPLIPLFTDFGGLVTEGESTTRPAGTASVCTNMRIGRGGKTLRKCHGSARWSANRPVAGEPVMGLFSFIDKAGQLNEIARVPSGYYKRTLGTDAWSSIKATNREDDGFPMAASIYGKLFIVDGYASYIYDGTTWSDWKTLTAPRQGIVSGTSVRPSTTLTSAGANSLTPDSQYEVFFTFVDNANPTKESPPSEILRVRTTAASLEIKINTGYAGRDATTATKPELNTKLFPLPSDVAALGANAYIYAYISAADTPGTWYRGNTAAIGQSSSEQTITITDDSTSNQFSTFHGPPTFATGVVLHHSRLWVWGSPAYPTRIWFSDLETAETFKAANFIDIGVDEPDDPVRACIPYGAGGGAELLIIKLNSVWKLTGNDLSTFVASLVMRGPSCMSDRAATAGPVNTIYWAGYEGAYRYDQGQVLNVTDGKIRDDWRSSNGLVAVN